MPASSQSNQAVVIDQTGLDILVRTLSASGHDVLGPVQRDGAIVFEEIRKSDDLARGWVEDQDGGYYRLERKGNAFFSHTTGPSSWKRILHPPRQKLWRTKQGRDGPRIIAEPVVAPKYAFLGVRACDLAAIAIQDKVFLEGPYKDQHYAARREALFIVAVNCARASRTCFCASMGSGPRAETGFDIALTEIVEGSKFVVEAGSDKGIALLNDLPTIEATDEDMKIARDMLERTRAQMGRHLETEGLPEMLRENPSHPRWDEVAQRCLNCANCTMVCPTCFCTTVDEESAIDGSETARVSRWASCFTTEFSHIHGGAVRTGAAARYRQWMTHKLSSWVDQFGQMGCTGCGRCITWCPVGIDITEEAAAIRETVKGETDVD